VSNWEIGKEWGQAADCCQKKTNDPFRGEMKKSGTKKKNIRVQKTLERGSRPQPTEVENHVRGIEGFSLKQQQEKEVPERRFMIPERSKTNPVGREVFQSRGGKEPESFLREDFQSRPPKDRNVASSSS